MIFSVFRFSAAAIGLVVVFMFSGCRSRNSQIVSIFHAASLSGVLALMEERLEKSRPGLDIRLEPSGSQMAARKVAELKRKADLVVVADRRIIDSILIPEHADFNIRFAANEVVLAHAQHSRLTHQITSENWYRILLQPEVRLGRADEHLAPIGYQTLLVWQLAERHYGAEKTGGGLAGRFKERCRPEHVVPDIAELVSLLEARVLDYAFVYRSIAEEHRLKVTSLPAACNLSRSDLSKHYASARVRVKMKSSKEPVEIHGAPIVYSLTIPHKASHPRAAQQVVLFLLSSEGRRLLRRFGFQPVALDMGGQLDSLPSWLGTRIGKSGPTP